MKKEGKLWIIMVISSFAGAIIFAIEAILDHLTIRELIIAENACVFFECYSLYSFLYGIKYHVTVTKEKIQLKTLFRSLTINLSDIKEYTYKRYTRVSVFYQFRISYLDKKVLINTRYYEEFDKILKEELNSRNEKLLQSPD